jgi:hypothetical protein
MLVKITTLIGTYDQYSLALKSTERKKSGKK